MTNFDFLLKEKKFATFAEVAVSAEKLFSVDLDACVRRRQSFGGTSPASVRAQIAAMRERLSL